MSGVFTIRGVITGWSPGEKPDRVQTTLVGADGAVGLVLADQQLVPPPFFPAGLRVLCASTTMFR